MQKSISLGSGFNPRRALVPAALSLAVAGAAGAYALRNEPGDAMPPRPMALQPASLAIGYQPEAPLVASFAEITPPQAARALQQVAQVRNDPEPFARSFAGAFKPMTEPQTQRQSVVALAREEAPEPHPGPAPVPEAVTVVEPLAAPASVAADPAPVNLAPAPVPPGLTEPAPVSRTEPQIQAQPAAEAAVAVVPEPPPAPVAPPAEPSGMAMPGHALDSAPAKQGLELAMVTPPVVPGPAPVSAVVAAPAEPAPAQLVAVAATPMAVPVADSAAKQASVQMLTPAVALKAAPSPAPEPAAKALASVARPKTAATLAKPAPLGKAKALAGPQIPSRYRLVEGGVETSIGVQMYGERLGAVPLRVLGNGVPSLQLSDLLGLIRSRLAPGQYERLAASAAAEEYVSLEKLRQAGIPVRYDAARDELKLGEE